MNQWVACPFADAAAARQLSHRLLLLRWHNSCLSENDLSTWFEFELWWHGFDGYCHMINNDSFLRILSVAERRGPSFESFEAEWKGVLTRCKSLALIDHCFLPSEHVPCLEIPHFVVLVCWGSNEARPIIIVSVPLTFTIRNAKILS